MPLLICSKALLHDEDVRQGTSSTLETTLALPGPLDVRKLVEKRGINTLIIGKLEECLMTIKTQPHEPALALSLRKPRQPT